MQGGIILAWLKMCLSFPCHPSFCRKRSLSLCFTTLVIITRMPASLSAQEREKNYEETDVNLSPAHPVSAEFWIKNIPHRSSLCCSASRFEGKLQLFSINRDTIDLNMQWMERWLHLYGGGVREWSFRGWAPPWIDPLDLYNPQALLPLSDWIPRRGPVERLW